MYSGVFLRAEVESEVSIVNMAPSEKINSKTAEKHELKQIFENLYVSKLHASSIQTYFSAPKPNPKS